jgi:CelD/BcsL family acetyltransferase involved in cellulose biosynthesis
MISKQAIEVQEINCLGDLLRLNAVWDGLLAEYGPGTLFLSHGYVCAWWRAFGAGRRLRVLVFRAAGRVIGIAPLMQRVQWQVGLPTRSLSPLRNKHILREDLLLPERPEGCLEAMMGYLARHRWQWDRLTFRNVPEGSPVRELLTGAARRCGLAASDWRQGRTHRVLSIEGDFAAYVANRSKNLRNEIRRYQRRLDGLARTDYQYLTAREAQLGVLEGVFELEGRSWKAQERNAALTEADKRFIRGLLAGLDEDQLGCTVLIAERDRLLAACFTLAQGTTLYGITTYYDPEASNIAPGTLMIKELLRRIWDGPWSYLDFNGDTPFIRRWGGVERAHYNMDLSSSAPYARILRGAWRARSRRRNRI